jgi:hypothetical protein
MTAQIFILLLLGIVLSVYAAIALTAWHRARGTRVIVCPETQQPEAVQVDAGHAAVSAMWEQADIRLKTCSRWPERQGCDQGCVTQIAIAPHDTLATTMLTRFFKDKRCTICKRPIAPVQAAQPRPGLLNVATGETLCWEELPARGLPQVLSTHLPVCASCQVAETFRRQFPDLVTDRAPRRNTMVN